jgi:hypothetical protein
MSKKTVAAKRTATAKAKPATVSDHLQRLVQAMPEPLQTTDETTCSPRRGSKADAAASRSDSLALDRMAEHRDFASRVAALAIVIQRDAEQDGALIPNLARALEDLAHAEYSTVAQNMSVIAELQAGREVHA